MEFSSLSRLLETLRVLRGPEGCPWDQSQDLASAARYLADEVFEYVEVAAQGDDEACAEELADLLYMLAYNWLLLHERSRIPFDELARLGDAKLRRRKPHVFDPHPRWEGMEADEIWRLAKAEEKSDSREEEPAAPSLLKDLHPSVSPLRQAQLHGQLAARADFDWSGPQPVFVKVREEIAELERAIENEDRPNIEEEVGDLLFAVVQLGRKLDVDPDLALARTNEKFARRFRRMEAEYDHDPAALRALGIEGLWKAYERAKKELRQEPPEGGGSGHPSSSSTPS